MPSVVAYASRRRFSSTAVAVSRRTCIVACTGFFPNFPESNDHCSFIMALDFSVTMRRNSRPPGSLPAPILASRRATTVGTSRANVQASRLALYQSRGRVVWVMSLQRGGNRRGPARVKFVRCVSLARRCIRTSANVVRSAHHRADRSEVEICRYAPAALTAISLLAPKQDCPDTTR